jgi:hypothetical protein
VHLRQLGQAFLNPRMHAGDQLQLRFAVIRGDVRVRQRRAQRRRVRGQCQAAIGQRTQAFLLDPAAYALQARWREDVQPLL